IIIIVSGIFLQETKASQSRINRQISQLSPWNKVRNWKRLELLGIENGSINNGEINEPESQYIQIATALKKLDFIYIKPSSVYIPDYMKNTNFTEDFFKKLNNDGITDPEVNKEMIYINKSGANIQNKVNGTDYQLLDNKVATIYIPDKFKEKKKSIENTVVAEQFTGTKYTKENLAVQIIPNEKKIFYFNENGNEHDENKEASPMANVTDSKGNIVVVLDTDKMVASKDFSLASNIVNSSLFSPEAIKKINDLSLHLNFSINPVDVYQLVKLNIQSLKHQIFLSKVLQKIIYGIVFLLIYQYAQLFISSKQNDYVKKIILGLSKTRIAISSLKYFIMTIAIVIICTFMVTEQIELLYIGIASLVVLILSTVMSFRKLSKKYTQILKGDEQ
ncbi:TPA: ABC transporter permease, partial [Streptococcus pyogenes]|nr:ABC transporter permease [Streptococcus pyogenes]